MLDAKLELTSETKRDQLNAFVQVCLQESWGWVEVGGISKFVSKIRMWYQFFFIIRVLYQNLFEIRISFVIF
jgi:hypothetical protein